MTRRSRWLLYALLAGFLLVSGWCLTSYLRVSSHGDWFHRVHDDLFSLRGKRPPEFTEGHWDYLVSMTLSLHSNCGAQREWVDPDWRNGFADELERRMARPLTLADFDWIWDEYVQHTKNGPAYDRFRPTRGEDWEAISGMKK